MRCLNYCLLSCACTAFAATANAQTPDSLKKPAAPAPHTPVYNLPAVEAVGVRNHGYLTVRTRTATKTDTPLRETPQSVSIITHDVIADQAMQNMSDVVRYIPGVTMAQGEGHRDAPTIRGNNSTADFFVDGVRDDAQYFRDLYNVERVEALKGANAMIFGRGGGGGIINRVTKQAQWQPLRSLTLEGGSYGHGRATVDVAQPLNDAVAVRLNGMVEDSRSFRDAAQLRRRALNPTATIVLGSNTTLNAGYEYFRDDRTVDRGIPSFDGRPAPVHITTFFGNPDSSYARARVQTASALVEHRAGALTVREHAVFADYDKFYQNSYAGGALNAAGTQVNLSAYNHSTPRRNAFSQTDFILHTGRSMQQTLLAGFELARQRTDNVRKTGYYGSSSASYTVDVADPTISVPIEFRQSASDADSRTWVNVAAVYAQDQLVLSNRWQAVAGVRTERFDVAYHNNRTGQDLARADALVSPRAGLIFKPFDTASLYASYSVSHLPSSGDQFSSLTATSKTLEPERFTNYEVGGKWDVRPGISLSMAAYHLDRTNTSAPDPVDPKLIVQTGSERSSGVEAGVAGDVTKSWHIVAGAALQRATIMSTTTAAKAGAAVPLVPSHTFSLWNRYDVTPLLGGAFGVVYRSRMFAAIDNTVTLPGFTRADAAVYVRVAPDVSLQINVENVFDVRYYATSQGNNNILPGSGRAFRISMSTRR